MSTARKNILKRIEAALQEPVVMPYPEHAQNDFRFKQSGDNLITEFKERFTELDGNYFYCGRSELAQTLKELITAQNWTNLYCQTPGLINQSMLPASATIKTRLDDEIELGVSDCECLIARTGTVVLSAAQASGRVLPVYAPVHLVITSVDQLVFDLDDALQRLQHKYGDQLPSAIFFASGPSRTADIEKRLVLGVHGPKQVFLILLKND